MGILQEHLTYDKAKITLEEFDNSKGGKDLHMNGIFIQGDIKNANQRIYPVHEINRAVNTLSEQLSGGYSVLGEIDHPDDLKINLDRVSHMIVKMWMDGPNGFGKLKILPTPMGKVIESMLVAGVKLGVSSRGSGNVDEYTGKVSDFEIVTVDIVATPSAQEAYPTPIYESLMNFKGGLKTLGIAEEAVTNKRVQKYLNESIQKFIRDLKI